MPSISLKSKFTAHHWQWWHLHIHISENSQEGWYIKSTNWQYTMFFKLYMMILHVTVIYSYPIPWCTILNKNLSWTICSWPSFLLPNSLQEAVPQLTIHHSFQCLTLYMELSYSLQYIILNVFHSLQEAVL